jgi:CheY-like chemotaxis protein
MTTDPSVLLVDDSPSDALLMANVFQRTAFDQPLRYVTSGEEAMAYLQGEGRYQSRTEFPMPVVVLLDWNMPRKNGLEVLAWIRRQPAFSRICVYILSASSRREDIDQAYALGANAYLVKPGRLDELAHMATILVSWFKLGHFATAGAGEEEPEGAEASALATSAGPMGHRWVR